MKLYLFIRKYPKNKYVCEQTYPFQQTQGFDKLSCKKIHPKSIPFLKSEYA